MTSRYVAEIVVAAVMWHFKWKENSVAHPLFPVWRMHHMPHRVRVLPRSLGGLPADAGSFPSLVVAVFVGKAPLLVWEVLA